MAKKNPETKITKIEQLTEAEWLFAHAIMAMRAVFNEEPFMLVALMDWVRSDWKGDPHVLKTCIPEGVAVIYARPRVEKLKAEALERIAADELRAAVTA